MSSKNRTRIVFAAISLAVWALFTVAQINEGSTPGRAAVDNAILIVLAGLGAAAINAAIKWALRGDE